MTHKEKNDMDNEVICIYFSDEPYVDATITKEELLAALKKQRGETVVEGVRPFAARIDKENPVGGKGENAFSLIVPPQTIRVFARSHTLV
jgi:hypothetical protein